MIRYVFCEADSASRLSIDREGNLARILRMLGCVMMRTLAFNVVINAACQDHAGLLRAVDKDDSPVTSEVRAVMQYPPAENLRLARVVGTLLVSGLAGIHLR